MRTITLALMTLALVASAGCNDSNMSTWVMTGEDTDVKALLGTEVADGVIVGGLATWTSSSDVKWGPEPTGVGFFAQVEASWVIQSEDTAPIAPIPVTWLKHLEAVPYARVEFLDDIENDNFGNLEPQWVLGTKFLLTPDGTVGLAAEYSDGDQAPSDVLFGGFLHLRF